MREAKIEARGPLGGGAYNTTAEMPSPKMLTNDQKEYVEVCFYQVWHEEPGDLYEFVVRETAAFIEENPVFAGLRGLVEKEFLRLARVGGQN